jgi:hypothetical protein
MTRLIAISRVSCTSNTAWRIPIDRSISVSSWMDAGTCARSDGIFARMASTTATVLASGWRWMPSTIERRPLNQLAILSFSTLSMTRAISSSFTGAPLRQATTTLRYSAARSSWPDACKM